MPSWHKVRPLIRLYETRKERIAAEIASLEALRRDSVQNEQRIEKQMDALKALLAEELQKGGVMNKTRLFDIRRHIAVLLREQQNIRVEEREAALQTKKLVQTKADEEQKKQEVEKKRIKYQRWQDQQRRVENLRERMQEDAEIEEKNSWYKL